MLRTLRICFSVIGAHYRRTLSGSVQENRAENDLTYFTVPGPNEGSSHRAHTLPMSKVRRELNDAAHLWNDTFIPSFAVLETPRA